MMVPMVAEATPSVLDPRDVETNMVFADTKAIGLDPVRVWRRLAEYGVLANVVAGKVRFVTHLDVTRAEVGETVRLWPRVVAETGGRTS